MPTSCSTPRRRSSPPISGSSATPNSRTCPASSRPRSRGAPSSAPSTRSTTWPSSGSGVTMARARARATTCGPVAGSVPTPTSANASAPSSRWTRSPMSGPASQGSSATTATAVPPTTTAQRDHVGVHPQRDGRLYVGFAPRAGRIYGHQLREVAHLADGFGTGLIRLTTQQKVVITNVEPTAADDLVAALDEHDLRVAPSVFRRQTMACTGIEFCKLAIVETKHRADWLYRALEE